LTRGHPLDRKRLLTVGSLSAAAVAVALISQHSFGMQPCPWCIVQRMLYVVMAIVALVAAAWPIRAAGFVQRRTLFATAVLAVLGAASALWQQIFAAKSSSCARTVADYIVGTSHLDVWLPEIFQARASCAESASMLGVPYAIWSLAAFLILAVVALRGHLEQRQRVVILDSNLDGLDAGVGASRTTTTSRGA
jgi:protein dithiol:quinone oxidoreductase